VGDSRGEGANLEKKKPKKKGAIGTMSKKKIMFSGRVGYGKENPETQCTLQKKVGGGAIRG